VYLYALEAIQKAIESSHNFSNDDRVPKPFFKNSEKIPAYSSTNRKKSTKNPRKNSVNREKESINLAFFENLYEIQKLFAYLA